MTTPPLWMQHGVRNTYVNGRCRCEECKSANAAYARATRERLSARREALPPEAHGSLSTFCNYSCKCDKCTAAKRTYNAERRVIRAEQARRELYAHADAQAKAYNAENEAVDTWVARRALIDRRKREAKS